MTGVAHPALQRAVERIVAGVGVDDLAGDPSGDPSGHPSGHPPPGAGLAVRIGDRTLSAVAGTRRGRPGDPDAEPMTLDTQHDLASVTKIAATTTLLMRLVDSGELALDDAAHAYLPGFRGGGKETVTVSQLLLHRAGLWEWWPLYLEHQDRDAANRFVDELPLRYGPGEARHYSDLGFLVLGRIVEAVTGTSIDDAFQELVARPLGLDATAFGRPADPAGKIAASSAGDAIERRMVDTGEPYPVPYRASEFSGWRTHELQGEVNDGNAHHVFGGVSGHAGLFGTLPDLVRLGIALASAELSGADTARTFFAPGPDAGQALGFRTYRAGTLDVRGHTGFTGVALAFVPDRNIALALATNRLHRTTTLTPVESMLAVALDALVPILEHSLPEDLP